MKQLTPSTIAAALHDMRVDLAATKTAAEEFLDDIKDVKPDDMIGGEQPSFPGGEEGSEQKGEKAPGGEKMPPPPEVKTDEEAKKVLKEVTEDVQAVVDHLEGVSGEVEEEEKKASLKRFNDRYASSLNDLAKRAAKAIDDTHDSMRHWSWVRGAAKTSSVLKGNSQLLQAAETLQQVGALEKVMNKIGWQRIQKSATAVPPTGAQFSGDKWPAGKDPKLVEDRAWHSGAEKFNRDKKWEDSKPNAAIEPRLVTDHEGGYNRDDKEYVNSTLVLDRNNKFASYWDVVDTKSGQRAKVIFANLPDDVGPRTERTFNEFSSQRYGAKICNNIITEGWASFVREANAEHLGMVKEADLQALTAEPHLKDKGMVRKYYADMFGDPSYARELTSDQKDVSATGERKPVVAKEKGKSDSNKMNIDYTPEKDDVSKSNTGEMPGKAKDGPGKLTSRTESDEVLLAKARRATELARKFASRNPQFEYNIDNIYAKAREYMKLSDAEFESREATLEELPIVNQAALKGAHIPDTETGITGNAREGVREPKATVKTEDINPTVKSDAKISTSAKTSSFVPQMQSNSEMQEQPTIGGMFNNVSNRLARKGVDPSRLRIARHRQS